jgi:hypothetical protein
MIYLLLLRGLWKGNISQHLLNAQLNPICHLQALLGAHHILHISRIRVNDIWFSHYYFSSLISLAFTQSEVTALLGNHLLNFPTQTILLLTPVSFFSSYMRHPFISTLLWALSCCKFSVHLFLSSISLFVVPQLCSYLQHPSVQPAALCHGWTDGNQSAWTDRQTDINDLLTFILRFNCYSVETGI